MLEWSRKQAKLIRMAEHGGQTYAVHGPVRSGKSMPAVHGFARMACKNFAGHEFIIASRSQRQLDAVIITYMREFAREHQMLFRKGESFYVLNSWLAGPPNKFYPLIGSDIASAEKASGITAAGALMDECHVMPQTFVNIVRERTISVPGSKVVMVMNPEGPSHWLKKEVIDEADNETIFDLPFQISDNENPHQRASRLTLSYLSRRPHARKKNPRKMGRNRRSGLPTFSRCSQALAQGRTALPTQH